MNYLIVSRLNTSRRSGYTVNIFLIVVSAKVNLQLTSDWLLCKIEIYASRNNLYNNSIEDYVKMVISIDVYVISSGTIKFYMCKSIAGLETLNV